MTPFEKITDVECRVMENYINDYAEENLGVSIEYFLREWNCMKQSLFDLFGQNLTLKKHVIFSKAPDQIANDINQNWCTMPEDARLFIDNFLRFCNDKRTECYERDYTSDEEYSWYCLEGMFGAWVLANNASDSNYTLKLPKPDRSIKEYKVQKGSKPLKVVGRVIDAFGEERFGGRAGFESFCVWHSQFLNDKKIEGDLCLSIHPIDYMTMSHNSNDWSSCMNWPEIGCYRSGTIEMMNSDSVIVAYLESKSEKLDLTYYDNMSKRQYYPWNSKKWRILLIANDKGLFSIKGYPYQHDELTKTALDFLASLYHDKEFKVAEQFHPYRDFELKNGTIVQINPRTYRMYNDFGAAPHFMRLSQSFIDNFNALDVEDCSEDSHYYLGFTYSGASECVACGGLSYINKSGNVNFSNEESLCCTSCHLDYESSYECPQCGCLCDPDDMIEVEGELICEDCFADYAFEDSFDYSYHYKAESIYLKIRELNGHIEDVGLVYYHNMKLWVSDIKKYNNFDERDETEYIVDESDLIDCGRRQWEIRVAQRQRWRERVAMMQQRSG